MGRLTESGRKRIAEANRRRVWSAKARQRISEVHKGCKWTKARKRLASKSAKAYWANIPPEEYQQRCERAAENIQGFWNTLSEADRKAFVDNLSAANRKRWASMTEKQRADFKAAFDKGTKLAVVANRKRWAEMSEAELAVAKERLRIPSAKGRKQAVVVNSKRLESSDERSVKQCLRKLGVEYRDHVQFGIFAADIYLPKQNAVIECDGEYWHTGMPRWIDRDKRKDAYLKSIGVKVVRIPIPNKKHLENPMWATIQALRKI